MFRKFVIAVITAMAAILETAADAIAATLPPPPAVDRPRLRVVASGRLCLRLLIMPPLPCQARAPSQQRPSRALMADPVPAAGGAPGRPYREALPAG